MQVAYISGPYRAKTVSGVLRNIIKAREVAIKYWKLGYAVICPHTNTAFMDGEAPDEVWLEGDKEIIRRLTPEDAIVMMIGWEDSEGAKAELELAKELGLKIIYERIVN